MSGPRPAGVVRRHIVAFLGLSLLLTSLLLGEALHHNQDGTALDRWFQRQTAVGARQPGQPGFHHFVYLALTRTILLGSGLGLAFLTGVATLILLWAGSSGRSGRRQAGAIFAYALAPIVALTAAGLSAEQIIKTAIDRRMLGNLGVLTYPSGHAVVTASVATATITLVMVLMPTSRPSPETGPGWWQLVAALLLAFVSLVVGVAMAVLRAHFLTDVIGGWAWGCGWGLIVSSQWARWMPAGHRHPIGDPPRSWSAVQNAPRPAKMVDGV